MLVDRTSLTGPTGMTGDSLIVVGNPDPIHVGAHFLHAAKHCEISAAICDTRLAFGPSRVLNKFNWWMRGRRPSLLTKFSDTVLNRCYEIKPSFLLTTGMSPISKRALA